MKFTIDQKFNLDIDINVLMIEEFKAIVNYDKKDRNRKRAKQLLLYVFIREELTNANPFNTMEYTERIKQAEHVAFGKNSEESKLSKKEIELVENAIHAYVKYSSTSEERLLFEIDIQIDEQNALLKTTKSTIIVKDEKTGETKEVTDAKYSDKLKKILDNVEKLIERKKKIRNIVKGTVEGRMRADKESSLLELGTFRNIKSKTGK